MFARSRQPAVPRAGTEQALGGYFTYCSTQAGFIYVAFVIDLFSRYIVGWRVYRSIETGFILNALEQAIHSRSRHDDLIPHSDRRSQYLAVHYFKRLAETGVEASVGCVGDSYDNALAETVYGLYKVEVFHRPSWKNCEEVEFETLKWVNSFNKQKLIEPIGNIPPAKYEALYYAQITEHAIAA